MDVILAEPHASGAHCVYVSVDLPVLIWLAGKSGTPIVIFK